ncbi:bacitracin ABC transporter ATP-binding protein [Exiguobacterium sp. BMC-KP]|uniref:ABC transporter ATP-binding protein n=1 Tax=Exiguobacterium sp. BMC-KP TaxID=1684312 RepID=UPI0006AA3702|nr:ABC transporter ATP-binding protein [Exiguobacterium sp. BMC-KP]KOP28865.1 bacitracin ABC transporter ATP-binding protein [Exiguobacterium sp. BMC-KP]
MEKIIEIESLTKHFSDKTALDDLNFYIKQKEIFGLLGPSGSGKTTIIKILTGQMKPSMGSTRLLGIPSEKFKQRNIFQKVGIMTDNSGLYDRLTVKDNLKLFCKIFSVTENRIHRVLELVNLSDEQNKKVALLSKGMKQRVLLARTFLHQPEILFLDEPTSALDPVNTQAIYAVLKDMNRDGATIFLTTHDMVEADTLCDRVAFLNRGHIQLLGSPKSIKQRFADQTLTLESLDGLEHVFESNEKDARHIYEMLRTNQVVSIHSNEPTLEDVFVKVTGSELR